MDRVNKPEVKKSIFELLQGITKSLKVEDLYILCLNQSSHTKGTNILAVDKNYEIKWIIQSPLPEERVIQDKKGIFHFLTVEPSYSDMCLKFDREDLASPSHLIAVTEGGKHYQVDLKSGKLI